MDLSPFGQKAGLKTRMTEWCDVLRDNRGYRGIIADIEAAIPFLPDDPPGSAPPPMRPKTIDSPAPAPQPKTGMEFDL